MSENDERGLVALFSLVVDILKIIAVIKIIFYL